MNLITIENRHSGLELGEHYAPDFEAAIKMNLFEAGYDPSDYTIRRDKHGDILATYSWGGATFSDTFKIEIHQ